MVENRDDQIYASPLKQVEDFRFDETVTRVFPDMIERSIPGYAELIPLIGRLARCEAQPGTRLYDLGASLGAVTLAMRHQVQAEGVSIHAVDNSSAMVERLRQIVAEDNARIPVNIEAADIRDVTLNNASVVVLNFTLQFLPPEDRPGLLENVLEGLRPGGLLILSEKLDVSDSAQAHYLRRWHEDYKRFRGYSDLEIAQKRQALEKVMLTDSLEDHVQRLQAAGYDPVFPWFQALPFTSIAAFKPKRRMRDDSTGPVQRTRQHGVVTGATPAPVDDPAPRSPRRPSAETMAQGRRPMRVVISPKSCVPDMPAPSW